MSICMNCKHKDSFHANPLMHTLKTSHCTALISDSPYVPCDCREFKGNNIVFKEVPLDIARESAIKQFEKTGLYPFTVFLDGIANVLDAWAVNVEKAKLLTKDFTIDNDKFKSYSIFVRMPSKKLSILYYDRKRGSFEVETL